MYRLLENYIFPKVFNFNTVQDQNIVLLYALNLMGQWIWRKIVKMSKLIINLVAFLVFGQDSIKFTFNIENTCWKDAGNLWRWILKGCNWKQTLCVICTLRALNKVTKSNVLVRIQGSNWERGDAVMEVWFLCMNAHRRRWT